MEKRYAMTMRWKQVQMNWYSSDSCARISPIAIRIRAFVKSHNQKSRKSFCHAQKLRNDAAVEHRAWKSVENWSLIIMIFCVQRLRKRKKSKFPCSFGLYLSYRHRCRRAGVIGNVLVVCRFPAMTMTHGQCDACANTFRDETIIW